MRDEQENFRTRAGILRCPRRRSPGRSLPAAVSLRTLAVRRLVFDHLGAAEHALLGGGAPERAASAAAWVENGSENTPSTVWASRRHARRSCKSHGSSELVSAWQPEVNVTVIL